MGCNNNTSPLVEENNKILNCNNGCSPKDINVVCRQIIIPYGQEVLGVQGDNNSSTRFFLIPDTTESGIDLKDKTFRILVENSNKEQWVEIVDQENVKLLDNYIKIKWNIGSNETAVNGNLKILIEAIADNFKWQTYEAKFIVKPSLNNSKNIINPPLNLQEKEIVPTQNTQIIEPDVGFNGLSKVTIQGDDNLIAENIKKGVTIFGITGEYE